MEIITNISDKYINIPENHFVFDIETTGLSSKFCKVILIGIVYNKDNKTIIKQFFALSENEEKELLHAFVNEIKQYKKHITFNGFTFDIPFLNSRFQKHNINFSLNKSDDLDILRLVKPYKEKLSLLDCKLKTIEKYIGITRNDTISGKDSVKLYKEFSLSQDKTLKDKILLHNYEDIYYLSQLIRIQDILEDHLNPIAISYSKSILKLVPMSYKFTNSNLIMKYNLLSGNINNITIYEDDFSLLADSNTITLKINVNKGIDKNNNNILFFNLHTIIPLKFNDSVLEENIYSLCSYILKKEISSL